MFRNNPSPQQTLWSRVAAALSFLAVLSALLAPVSMLAEEVRTGKLGGLCSAGAAWAGDRADAAPAEAAPAAAHCDLCASLGLVLPTLPLAVLPCFAGDSVAVVDVAAPLSASDPGLPYSRGPPAL